MNRVTKNPPVLPVRAEDASPQGTDQRVRPRKVDGLQLLERFGLIVIFAALVLLFSLLRPSDFATAQNWQGIATTQAGLGVIALSLLPPLICGRFDISVGAIMALTSIACAYVMSKWHVPLVPAVAAGLAVGAIVGVFNGVAIAYFGVNSIICTLATSIILGGLTLGWTGGTPISNGLSTKLTNLGVQKVLGLPVLFLVMVAIGIGTWFLLTQTPYGRRLAAVGSNINAARLNGINVKKTVLLSFVASGMLAGAAGVLVIALQGSADPDVGSLSDILPAFAATFLGATTWRPGTYSVQGTLIGLFFLGTTISGLELIGVGTWVPDVFNGSVVIIAIALAAQFRKRRTGVLEVGE